MMNKNEILEKSRKENRNMDEREKEAMAQAGNFGALIGGFICMAIVIINAIFGEMSSPVNSAVWGVYTTMAGSTLLFKFVKLRKKHELIFAIIQLLAAAMFFAMYIMSLRG